MRARALLAALILFQTLPASAQEWTEFKSMQDRFSVLFPGEPSVAETPWKSEMGFVLPSRVYRVERGRERYSVTVVDYRETENSSSPRERRS